jgi:hypothetical protein
VVTTDTIGSHSYYLDDSPLRHGWDGYSIGQVESENHYVNYYVGLVGLVLGSLMLLCFFLELNLVIDRSEDPTRMVIVYNCFPKLIRYYPNGCCC